MANLTKNIGTVTLSGVAEKVTLPADYGWVWVKNMSDSNIFAGLSADISEGADGVLTIPAGECGRVQADGFRSVYLLGSGSALVVAQNYADCPFKVGAKGGEIPDLSAYAKKSDIPDKVSQLENDSRYLTKHPVIMPDEGRTIINDLQFGDSFSCMTDVKEDENGHILGIFYQQNTLPNIPAEYAKKTDIQNENLLINPDFKINQRGDNSYTERSGYKYTVDRWEITGTCTPTSTGVTVSADGSAYDYGSFCQPIENYISNRDVTLSAKVNGEIHHITGNTSESSIGRINITDENGNDVGYLRVEIKNGHKVVEFIIYQGCQMKIEWVKLEYGSIATPFVSPEPITELLKCQRYYQIHSTNNISTVDLRPNMRNGVVPTITALADGNFSYEAEL